MRCGLVIVDRRSDPNERQRALLERLAAGEEHPAAWAPGDWRSAYALRDRGLLRISRGGGEALVEVTEDGRYFLRHGDRREEPTSAEAGDQAAIDWQVGPCQSGVYRRSAGGGRRSARSCRFPMVDVPEETSEFCDLPRWVVPGCLPA